MTKRSPTYQDIWDQYAAGKVSTSVMRRLLEDDEVFRQWCIRKAEAERKERDRLHQQQISDEDMA